MKKQIKQIKSQFKKARKKLPKEIRKIKSLNPRFTISY